MIKKYYVLLLMVFVMAFTAVNAQDAPVLTFSVPYQNNVKYNRFLINPAFSFVREDNTYITIYHRNQWVQYDDSPKVYMLSYNGKFTDKTGFGFGIYQQRLGVISSFGGIANYAYNVKIKDKFNVTLGFNVAYYNSGIDKNRTITEEPDPVLLAMRNNSLVSIKPGINVGYKGFDFGIYAENFVDYDFKSAGMAKLFTNKTYSGHAMYTYQIANGKDLFKDSMLRVMLRGRTSEEFGFGVSGSFLADFPSFGWLQTGIDDYYGVAIGAGFHFTKRLSLGYTFERTTKEGLVNLGPTHEITMVFAFKDRAVAKKELVDEQKKQKDTLAELEEKLKEDLVKPKDSVAIKRELVAAKKDSITAAEKEDLAFDRKAELEKLKLDMDSDSQHLIDALIQEDSVARIRKNEFDQKVKNLKEYAAREKSAKEQEGANKPLELKNIKQGKKIAKPITLEDLKYAPDGYYVISKDIKAKDSDKTVAIEKHKTFTEAANASEKKRASGKEKGVYIVHVDNNPNPELEEQINDNDNKPNTLQNETPTKTQSKDALVASSNRQDVKGESLKTEAETKESGKTDKPREALFASHTPEVKADSAKTETVIKEQDKTDKPREALFASHTPEVKADSAKADEPKKALFASHAPEALADSAKTEEENKESVKNDKPREGLFSSHPREIKAGSLKTEEEIKEFYSDKTSKPRETVKKVNRLSVEGMEPGYYIIANVFSGQENAENFVSKMAERGLRAGVFLNPKNNFSYVYLKKHITWREALISYYSNVDNTYFDPIWIMSINTN